MHFQKGLLFTCFLFLNKFFKKGLGIIKSFHFGTWETELNFPAQAMLSFTANIKQKTEM